MTSWWWGGLPPCSSVCERAARERESVCSFLLCVGREFSLFVSDQWECCCDGMPASYHWGARCCWVGAEGGWGLRWSTDGWLWAVELFDVTAVAVEVTWQAFVKKKKKKIIISIQQILWKVPYYAEFTPSVCSNRSLMFFSQLFFLILPALHFSRCVQHFMMSQRALITPQLVATITIWSGVTFSSPVYCLVVSFQSWGGNMTVSASREQAVDG